MNVLYGLDTRTKLDPYIAHLAGRGFDFVVRYFGNAPARNLTQAEASALSEAGLQLGVVWESGGYQRAFFTYEQGLADGAAAHRMGREIGQPARSAIYFAVDYDACGTDIVGPVTSYFKGVRAAFNAVPDEERYEVGVYGSGSCCRAMLYARLARFGWLSQTRAYSGYLNYSEHNLKQLASEVINVEGLPALHFDRNQTNPLQQTGFFRLNLMVEA